MKVLLIYGLLGLIMSGIVDAKRSLSATSLVTCMEHSQLSATNFNVTFNPDDRSVNYRIDMTSEVTGKVLAKIEVWAYGFKVIARDLELCSLQWKQFCPLHPGNIEIESTEYISKEYTDQIPGIAYQVPDIDAFLKVWVLDETSGKDLACIQAFFTNGKTVSQVGVKWATAVIAGLGLLVSAILSTYGNSNAASHISANTMSLFLYFQSVVVVSMEHVHAVPPIAAAWAENLVWTMGLVRLTFMQKIFRWYVQATGGSPTLYLTAKNYNILAQRSLDYMKYIISKRENVLYGNSSTLIFRGIKRLAYKVQIESTSIVCTGITFFVLFGYFIIGLIFAFKCVVELCIRNGWMKQSRYEDFRLNWKSVLKGVLFRYIFLGFTQMSILCLWEFTQQDSAAVILLSVLFLVLIVGIMIWAAHRTIKFARDSISLHQNPAAVLYGDENVLNKYGFFYTMYNANHYWWSCVILSYNLLKAMFIALVQVSGKVQAVSVFLFDLCYLIVLCKYKPYLDRATNLLNILISVVTVINSFIFLFFSDLFHQPGFINSILGWIFFILNAAFSLVLLLMILVYIGLVCFSKNPDLRFRPAKDDRTSFQRKSTYDALTSAHTAELLALGIAAKTHNENWESELQKQQSLSQLKDSSLGAGEGLDSKSKELEEKESVAGKLMRKLSLKRNKSVKPEYSQLINK
ncbi:transient receptor potential ion channel family protein Ecym_2175 [Eremothecium cymbalariae DBVPG|uniref:ML-like domain-containing protein n=1 Tax=Eremothecium cymbalariae (strain CBS 270.75 / DBVPG 7215 / KCTC 17166 / NRRL Y-17582) TaxID=931890 RepID=G8JNL0_ERECY|nr:Hypothetical protein Ecym_2175 [Eremothecium cymbalariae DBVPG\